MTDQEKIEAVREAFDTGSWVFKKVNSRPGWSKTAQVTLERRLRRVLRIVLDREPTPEEVQQAGASD